MAEVQISILWIDGGQIRLPELIPLQSTDLSGRMLERLESKLVGVFLQDFTSIILEGRSVFTVSLLKVKSAVGR